jgi:trans-aconitate 2-methyltransferase
VQDRWYSPSISEFATLLEKHGLAVQSARLFDRPTALEDGEQGLENWLNMFAGELLSGLSNDMYQELLRRVQDRLRPVLFRDGRWYADRRGLFVTAIRE